MTGSNTARRWAGFALRLLRPSLDAPQRAGYPDLFEDAARIALINMHAKDLGVPVLHRDKTPWFETRPPWPSHQCRTHTVRMDEPDRFVFRCACGAIRGDQPDTVWIERNSRLRP